MKFTIYQESRLGRREENEDRIAYSYSRDALLMVVADGMGGHHHGEVAAQIAVQYLTESFQREATPALSDPYMFLSRSITNAHYAIADYAEDKGIKDPPRTTIVACVIQDSIAYWAHAGDSRLYLIRDERVAAQTRDHNRVQQMLAQGLIDADEAAAHPDRNKVFSCLGGPQSPQIEFSRKTPLSAGDFLLICTDGLWSGVSADEVAQTLSTANLMQAVPNLMRIAEERGGEMCDNLSAIAVRWEEEYGETSVGGVSTQTLAPGAFTTQMTAFGKLPSGAPVPDLTDEEIEKAIAEIRSAIEKYTD